MVPPLRRGDGEVAPLWFPAEKPTLVRGPPSILSILSIHVNTYPTQDAATPALVYHPYAR